MLGSRPISGAPLGGSAFTVGPINGNLTRTEDDDVLAASGALSLTGSLGSTEIDDVATAAGALTVTASAFIAEAGDSGASTATVALAGALTVTEGADVPSASGTIDLVGSAAVIEQGDTLGALGALEIEASFSATEEDDTLSASALMPIWCPRRGGDDDWAKYERQQIEWHQQLRRIIDRSWRIANGEIDPVTFEPIQPPDYSVVIGELINQALALDQVRVKTFIAEQKRLQEEEAIAVLLLAA